MRLRQDGHTRARHPSLGTSWRRWFSFFNPVFPQPARRRALLQCQPVPAGAPGRGRGLAPGCLGDPRRGENPVGV